VRNEDRPGSMLAWLVIITILPFSHTYIQVSVQQVLASPMAVVEGARLSSGAALQVCSSSHWRVLQIATSCLLTLRMRPAWLLQDGRHDL